MAPKKTLNLKLKKTFVNRFEWAVRQLLSLSGGDRHITTLSEEEAKLSKEFVELLLFLEEIAPIDGWHSWGIRRKNLRDGLPITIFQNVVCIRKNLRSRCCGLVGD